MVLPVPGGPRGRRQGAKSAAVRVLIPGGLLFAVATAPVNCPLATIGRSMTGAGGRDWTVAEAARANYPVWGPGPYGHEESVSAVQPLRAQGVSATLSVYFSAGVIGTAVRP